MGHCKGGPQMSYSPNKMGHESPAKNQNKGYAKQERKDLMQDMPIVKDAMGGRSWMSKHSKSALHFNAPKHNHTHPKGDAAANTGHTGNVKTTRNTSKKNIEKAELGMSMKYSPTQMGHSPAEMGHESPAKHKGSVHGTKHSEEVGHDGTGIHSHSSGKQKKRDDQMAAAEKRKKVKATVKAGKAIAKSM